MRLKRLEGPRCKGLLQQLISLISSCAVNIPRKMKFWSWCVMKRETAYNNLQQGDVEIWSDTTLNPSSLSDTGTFGDDSTAFPAFTATPRAQMRFLHAWARNEPWRMLYGLYQNLPPLHSDTIVRLKLQHTRYRIATTRIRRALPWLYCWFNDQMGSNCWGV